MAEIARFKLRQAVTTYSGPVHELVLREPTGGLYLRLGDPIRRVYEIAEDGTARRLEQIVRRDVCRQYIAELSDIQDPQHVDQMHPRDIDKAVAQIVRYFRFEDETDETGAVAAGPGAAGAGAKN